MHVLGIALGIAGYCYDYITYLTTWSARASLASVTMITSQTGVDLPEVENWECPEMDLSLIFIFCPPFFASLTANDSLADGCGLNDDSPAWIGFL